MKKRFKSAVCCMKCFHIFKPSILKYIFSVSSADYKFLKCPKCLQNAWCKKIDDETKYLKED